jgi:hypothetical protein
MCKYRKKVKKSNDEEVDEKERKKNRNYEEGIQGIISQSFRFFVKFFIYFPYQSVCLKSVGLN